MRLHDSLVVLLVLSASTALSSASPAPQDPSSAATSALRRFALDGRIEEELSLPDLAGKTRALFAENEGKALVVVFWSRKDPVSRFYLKPLAELQKARADKLTVVLVNSNHNELVAGGDPIAKLRETLAAEKVTLPVLLDEESKLADAFRATANGQVFLIDANRFVRYQGGIDDDPTGEKAKQKIAPDAWLETAIEQVLAGEKPKVPWTHPAGLPIKRGPKGK